MRLTVDQVSSDLRGYIKRAAAGETITIEENGRPLARLIGEDPAVIRLLATAKALGWKLPTQPKRPISEVPVLQVGGKPASEMVIEDRR